MYLQCAVTLYSSSRAARQTAGKIGTVRARLRPNPPKYKFYRRNLGKNYKFLAC